MPRALLIAITIVLVIALPIHVVCQVSSETKNQTNDKQQKNVIADIDKLNTCVSIVTKLIGAVVGVLGLILGFFYYRARNNIDDSVRLNERKRAVFDMLLKELGKYDELVVSILDSNFNDEKELKLIRSRIDNGFYIITSYLENSDNLLELTKKELNTISAVSSFVDKNKIIMHEECSPLNRASLEAHKNNYRNVKTKAFDLLVNKISLC